MRSASGVLALVILVLSVGIVAAVMLRSRPGQGDAADRGAPPVATTAPATALPRLLVPEPTGVATLGPLTDAPSEDPSQAGDPITGAALPTNQWWTSALIGPGTGELWAMPLAVNARIGGGIDVRVPALGVSPDAVVSSADPGLTLVAEIASTDVVGFDDFSVDILAELGDGRTAGFRVAQGSPSITIELSAGPIVVDTHRSITTPAGPPTDLTEAVTVDGRSWQIVSDVALSWSVSDTRLETETDRPTLLTLVPRPDHAIGSWTDRARAAAEAPVVGTSADLGVDWSAGTVTQTLSWIRAERAPADGVTTSGVAVLLPHQFDRLTTPVEVLGTFASPRGTLRVVAADSVAWTTPTSGFLPGVPTLGGSDGGIDSDSGIDSGIDSDSAQLERLLAGERRAPTYGSYFGSQQLATLASDVEIGRRLGLDIADLETLLADEVADALDSSRGDLRWLAYDRRWGGIIAQPAEFGSENYNDHHFHYGYVVHAATVVAEGDPNFVVDYGAMVDLLVADYLGDPNSVSLPTQRVFNPYLGHSYASGFGLFADGNNQESSSEAVNAWWAAARWGLVSGQATLTDTAIAHYAIEAVAARTYWLGEDPTIRPEGYAHREAGIVWGGKIDFATWFDPRPAAVIGIQLLPVNFGSIYRTDVADARARYETTNDDPVWPAVTAMDLALAMPAEALEILDGGGDATTSPAFARFWVLALQELGPPRDDIVVDGPYGAAFGPDDALVLVGVNPTDRPVEVRFRRDGDELGGLTLDAHTAATLRP